MANESLGKAKSRKNDEFYTVYDYIQKEMNAYLEYDPNVFRGKTILLPCDDPEWSNFTKYFAQKRVRTKFWTTIGLRKEPFYVFKRTKGYCTTDISSNRVCN